MASKILHLLSMKYSDGFLNTNLKTVFNVFNDHTVYI